MAAVGLFCHVWSFSICSKQELLSFRWTGFSLQRFLLLWSTGSNAQALGRRLIVVHGLSCSTACGTEPTSPALAGRFLTRGWLAGNIDVGWEEWGGASREMYLGPEPAGPCVLRISISF